MHIKNAMNIINLVIKVRTIKNLLSEGHPLNKPDAHHPVFADLKRMTKWYFQNVEVLPILITYRALHMYHRRGCWIFQLLHTSLH